MVRSWHVSFPYCGPCPPFPSVTSKCSGRAFKNVFDGLEPYSWQLDICEALLLGLDCIVITGTGAGKTMPFIMPLLVDPTKKKVVVIISPLNALEHDTPVVKLHSPLASMPH
ncbi:hypothetical protein BC827DRAFT_1344993 [Russula dissimulans]|nr:hypothetical protein BC827DRAFT_1344993 [Russula dissimulans]